MAKDQIREEKYFTAQVYIVKFFRGGTSFCSKRQGVYYVVGNRFYDIECNKSEASFDAKNAGFCEDPHRHHMYVEPIIFYIPADDIKLVVTRTEVLEIFDKYKNSEHNMEKKQDSKSRSRKR